MTLSLGAISREQGRTFGASDPGFGAGKNGMYSTRQQSNVYVAISIQKRVGGWLNWSKTQSRASLLLTAEKVVDDGGGW